MGLTKEDCQKALENAKAMEFVIRDDTHGMVQMYGDVSDTDLWYTFEQLIKEHFDNPIFTSQKHRQMYDCYKKVIERCAVQSEVIKELNDQLSKYDEWEMSQVQVRTNPPLKREEIHEMVRKIDEHDVVIFDDEDKCYIRLYLDQEGILYFFHFGNECESLFVFEDNRFYRREVHDE